MLNENFLLQAGGSGQAQLINFAFIAAMFLVFWLLILRPQAKRQREQKGFLDGLEKGQEVITASGILGKITKIEDNIITLEVASKVYLRITRNAISKELTDSFYGAGTKS